MIRNVHPSMTTLKHQHVNVCVLCNLQLKAEQISPLVLEAYIDLLLSGAHYRQHSSTKGSRSSIYEGTRTPLDTNGNPSNKPRESNPLSSMLNVKMDRV